jgi:nitric oxide reductase subunit C
MKTGSKRIIMGILISCFFIYTILVYTFGTKDDKGIDYITPSAIQGKYLFQKYNCTSCHQIYGLGGYMGPDLTNVISKYKENILYVNAMLQNGSDRMPAFNLKEDERNSIIEYLNYIDKTGISPVIKFKINYDGTITQNIAR